MALVGGFRSYNMQEILHQCIHIMYLYSLGWHANAFYASNLPRFTRTMSVMDKLGGHYFFTALQRLSYDLEKVFVVSFVGPLFGKIKTKVLAKETPHMRSK